MSCFYLKTFNNSVIITELVYSNYEKNMLPFKSENLFQFSNYNHSLFFA